MDRRQRKLQQKRKKREQAKKRSRIEAAHRPSDEVLLARAGARAEFGPCFVSVGWNDLTDPGLVTLIVTRRLGFDELLPHTLLLDRTCLGVKNAMLSPPMAEDELAEFVEKVGVPHGGLEECEVLLAQSLIFNAVDYAKGLGFSPHADFHEALIGPRPEVLLATPWSRPERPIYVSGPDDDVFRIVAQLRHATGGDFEHSDPFEGPAALDVADAFDLLEDGLDEEGEEDEEDEGSEGREAVRRTS
jgi:hypothetical protein